MTNAWQELMMKTGSRTGAFADEVELFKSSLSTERVEIALALNFLFVDQSSWIHRRVESIKFLNQYTIRRSVSFDFSLDGLSPDVLDQVGGVLPLPVTLLKKETLRQFDLRDSSGRSVPVMTKAQNTQFIGDAMVVVAETILDEPLTGKLREIGDQIRALVGNDEEVGRRILRHWRRAARMNSHHALRDEWSMLITDEGFSGAAQMLTYQFVMLAALPKLDRKRHVLKMAYDEVFEPAANSDRSRSDSVLETTGWRFRFFHLEAPAVGLAKSFHVEIHSPPDLSIERASLIFDRSRDADTSKASDTPPDEFDEPEGDVAHLYCSNVPSDFTAEMQAFIRPSPQGVGRSAFLIAGMVYGLLLLLYVGIFWDKLGLKDSQSAATLMLLAPAFFAAFAIRQDEHQLATSVMTGIRFLALLAVSLAVIAATTLAIDFSDTAKIWIWQTLIVVSGFNFWALARAGLSPLNAEDARADKRNKERLIPE